MTWSIVFEGVLVLAVYLVVDRSAFWFMSNTFGQVSGKLPGIAYADIAFPRLLIAAVGCVATVAGRSKDINVVNVAGLVAILVSLVMLCVAIMKRYWSERDA